jgi:uncharacterized membrane protein HdeD (DUF308 family)
VSATQGDRSPAVGYWLVAVLRAAAALAVAVVVTFSADHSPAVGMLVFGLFAILSGAIVGLGSWRTLDHGATRTLFLAQGVVAVLAGIAALALRGASLTALLLVLTTFAVVTGALELVNGVRSRGASPLARDWVFVGAATVVLAIAVLLVPVDLQQQFTGPDGVARVLSASVVVVGLLGAYCAIVGVYLAIGGLSLKWSAQPGGPATLVERSN